MHVPFSIGHPLGLTLRVFLRVEDATGALSLGLSRLEFLSPQVLDKWPSDQHIAVLIPQWLVMAATAPTLTWPGTQPCTFPATEYTWSHRRMNSVLEDCPDDLLVLLEELGERELS